MAVEYLSRSLVKRHKDGPVHLSAFAWAMAAFASVCVWTMAVE